MNLPHAIITGGSSGIGKALAKMLSEKNYQVSILARRQELINKTISEIKNSFGLSVDVSDSEKVSDAINQCCEKFGPPDLLINSAGIVKNNYFEKLTTHDFEKTMNINYFGTLYAIRAALPLMKPKSQIIMISSAAGLTGLFGYSAYAPTKFALRGLAECLRAELDPKNISVSIVYPPNTQTPQLEEERLKGIPETQALSNAGGVYSVDCVAKAIMRGISRRKFIITPGFETTLLCKFHSLFLPLLNEYFDYIVRKHGKK